MSRAQIGTIISEALQLANNPNLTARAQVWIQDWLDNVYDSWDWLFLNTRYGPFSLASGATKTVFGDSANGGGTTTDQIIRVKAIKMFDSVNTGYKGDVEIVSDMSVHPMDEPGVLDTNSPGTPQRCLVEHLPETGGSPNRLPYAWNLNWIPATDKAYRFMVAALRRPGALSFGAGGANTGDYPAYPTDETMKWAILYYAFLWEEDERVGMAEAKLASLLQQDKMKYGKQPGMNSKLLMNPTVFKRYKTVWTSWPWPAGP